MTPSAHLPALSDETSLGLLPRIGLNAGFVLWALGHELAHGLFTLRPFGFQQQNFYPAVLPSLQHNDPEFRRVTRGVADLLWDICHSSDQRARMLSLDKDSDGRECAYLSNLSRRKADS